MKRIMAIAAAAILALAVFPAASAGIYDDYSTEDLQYVVAALQAEILARLGDPFIVYQGVYIGGTDLPVGPWRVDPLPGTTALITLYASDDYYMQQLPFFTGYVSEIDNTIIGRINITDGVVVEVTSGAALFSAYMGVDGK